MRHNFSPFLGLWNQRDKIPKIQWCDRSRITAIGIHHSKRVRWKGKKDHWFIAVLKSSWANVESSFVKFQGLEITLVWRTPSLITSILYIIRFYPSRSCSLFFSRKVTRVYNRTVISVCFLLLDLKIWLAAFVLYSLSILVQVNSVLLK